jgi:deazaflavin-dependent oxidoreductase (nitroreductase family)
MLKIIGIVVGALALFWVVVVALFERFAPRRIVRYYQRHIGGPMFMKSAGVIPGWGVVETTGRRTGKARRTPVGGRLDGRTFWLVAGDDRRADYIHNLIAEPKVRVRTRGRWHVGRAVLCPDDDARRRAVWANPINGVFLRLANTRAISVRVDLDANDA